MKRIALLSILLLAAVALAGDAITAGKIEVAPSTPISLGLLVKIPPAFKVAVDAPFNLDIVSEGPAIAQGPQSFKGKGKDLPYTLHFASGAAGEGALNIKMMLFVCQADHEGVCQKMDAQIKVPVSVTPNGANAYDLPIMLSPRF